MIFEKRQMKDVKITAQRLREDPVIVGVAKNISLRKAWRFVKKTTAKQGNKNAYHFVVLISNHFERIK
jgi:hypothetical protein